MADFSQNSLSPRAVETSLPSVQLLNCQSYAAVVSCRMCLTVVLPLHHRCKVCARSLSLGLPWAPRKGQLFNRGFLHMETVPQLCCLIILFLGAGGSAFLTTHRFWCCNQSFGRHAMTCQHLDTMFFGTDASPDVGRDSENH